MSLLTQRVSQAICLISFLSYFGGSDALAAEPLIAPTSGSITTRAEEDVSQAGPLSDVPLDSWAYDAVNQLAKDGIIKGYPDGTFKGGRPMTRREVAVTAFRAVEMLDARIDAGLDVDKADIAVADKLMAAFGDELKAVQTHVAALQKQADATDVKLAQTTATVNAVAATARRTQIHAVLFERAFNYDQNIQANNGPLPVIATANGQLVRAGQAFPAYTGVGPTGSIVVGPSSPGVAGSGIAGPVAWGNQPMSAFPQNLNTIGNQNHGLGMSYLSLVFTGQPDDRTSYAIKMTNSFRYAATSFLATTSPAYCANAGGLTGATCTASNAGAVDADGVALSTTKLQELWYRYQSPGGIYLKVGKFQQDEGPKQFIATAWNLTDIIDGGIIGYRNASFNAQAGYGYGDSSATQNTIYGIPATQQMLFGEADYQLDKGRTTIGVTYNNYSGYHETLWDPYAILCQGITAPLPAYTATAGAGASIIPATTGNLGTSKIIPLTAGQIFTAGGCGAGFAPISYGAGSGAATGLPITGAYTSNGSSAAYPNTSTIGAFAVENYGKVRLVVEGSMKTGNNPFTKAAWTGNLSGFFQLDYGPFLPLPGSKGKNTLEIGGYAAGVNGLNPALAYAGGPFIGANFTTDPAGYYFGWLGIKRYLTDTSSLGLFVAHLGLLPNTIIPAGSPNCPGCQLTGDSRNSIFGELNLAF